MTCLRLVNKNKDDEIGQFILQVYKKYSRKKVVLVAHTICSFCNGTVTSHKHWCPGCLGDYCAFEKNKNQACPKHSFTYYNFSTIVCKKCGIAARNDCVNLAAEELSNCSAARSSFHQIAALEFLCKKCFEKNKN